MNNLIGISLSICMNMSQPGAILPTIGNVWKFLVVITGEGGAIGFDG